MIAAAALLALAGPSAAVCRGAPPAPAAKYLADETAHRALRAELGIPMPTDPEHITIYTAGGHVGVAVQTSIVATRRPDGAWEVNAVERYKQAGNSTAATGSVPRLRTLSAADGNNLDSLLAMRAFWYEPPDGRAWPVPPPDLRRSELTIDVVTPMCSRRASVSERGPAPLLAEVLQLLTGT
ncbi:hypothetical protein KZ810_15140 [Sphingomonas sp. RHCKR47]|uniref:hypothetical protein n=1 Tax=Sphingomonas citricola TaxID=2862498 RepID=UPI001CA4D770|nr:hypothetical protein [Sphingomonas citricola]MBW6524833.1 hypothetical protein [Sphingomonas citricola]